MAMTVWPAVVLTVALAAGSVEGAAGPQGTDSALVRGNDQFAFDLYGQLRGENGNVFFSPYSISTALGMTYAGARGPTATEMATALRFPLTGDRLHEAFARVSREVRRVGSGGKAELSVANALWPQTGLPVDAAFKKTVESLYGAGLTPLDFRNGPEQARITINAWVEQQTRDRIKNLIPEGAIGPDARLVLTNAIYFKGVWKHPFPDQATRGDAFTLSPGEKVSDVPFMRQSGQLRYLDGGTFQALELPYRDDELSMIVLLPKQAGGLAELEAMLTAKDLADVRARMTVRMVDVMLPRFKVTAEFRLRETLSRLGMPLAFSNTADFSGVAKGDRLKLSDVFHKAYVEVNEKGTEAAAATGGVAVPTSAGPPRELFRADHPFFFVIRENGTGSLLFVGRLANPLAK
jgi:serine protease inhibitor